MKVRGVPFLLLLLAPLLVLAVALPGAWRQAPRAPARIDAAALERQADDHPDDDALLLSIGETLRRAGESQRAFDIVARVYERRYPEPRIASTMAELLMETGQLQDAHALATAYLRQAPATAEMVAVLAGLSVRAGRYDQGLELARKAVRLAPESPRAWRYFAQACGVEKLLQELWPAFDRALALAPDDGGLLADYGEALGRYGRAAEAEATLRRAVALRPRDPRALGLLGALLGQRATSERSRQEGIALLRQAAEIAPTATEPRYQLGKVLLLAGRPAEAVAPLSECLDLDPGFGEAWLPLGQAHHSIGSVHEAANAFARYERFATYRREAAHLNLRLRRAPHSFDLLLRMARLQERYGRGDLAERYYRQARAARRRSGG